MKFLADPLFWFWLLLVAAGAVYLFRRQRRRAAVLFGVALLASGIETLEIPARLLAALERPYVRTHEPNDATLKADALLILGGYMSPFPPSYTGFELDDEVD